LPVSVCRSYEAIGNSRIGQLGEKVDEVRWNMRLEDDNMLELISYKGTSELLCEL
jgi:hypothetical protein